MIRRFVPLAVSVMVGIDAVWAGANVWTRLGPERGPVTALAIDPQNAGTVYASTDAGLFARYQEASLNVSLGNSADARLAWREAAESFEGVGAQHEAAEINALLASLPA